MKTLSIFFTSVFLAGAAPAANFAIKNDTGAPQRLVIYQDGKVAGYVDRLRPGKTLLVKVDDGVWLGVSVNVAVGLGVSVNEAVAVGVKVSLGSGVGESVKVGLASGEGVSVGVSLRKTCMTGSSVGVGEISGVAASTVGVSLSTCN